MTLIRSAAAVCGNIVFHHGGLALKDDELCYTDDVYLYDQKTAAWTFLSKEEPYRASKQHSIGLRAEHTAIPLNHELVLVFGGRSPKTSSEFSSLTQYYVFDLSKRVWIERDELKEYSNIPKKLGSLYIGDSGEYGIYHGIEKSKVDRTVLRMANRTKSGPDQKSQSLVNGLYNLYKEGKCTDFTISGVDCGGDTIVEDRQEEGDKKPKTVSLNAHTAVLYARWKYFANLYDSGMQESSTRTLHIEEPFPWVKALVHYLYTDSIEELDLETVAGVMILAHIYDLPELEDICTSQICNSAAYSIHQQVLFWYRGYVAENQLVQQKFARLCFESRDKVSKVQAFQDLERVGLLSTLCTDMFSLSVQ